MKRFFSFSLVLFFLISCNSIKKHNLIVDKLISEKKLKNDIDFIYNKLQKRHPKLYWYISKEQLDFKFDSLKQTINHPITSFEFYTKISPVIAQIKQGHISVIPNLKLFTKKETSEWTKKGTGPFSQFEFDYLDDKLYIIKNKSSIKNIKPGSEVIAINDININNLAKEFSSRFASDGYNTTFKKKVIGKSFPQFFSNQNGIKDSLIFTLKYNDSTHTFCVKRKVIDSAAIKKNEVPKKLTKFEKAKKKADDIQKDIKGFDITLKTYNRELKFIEKDSSIAILKIKRFAIGNYATFYDESFSKIENYKSKSLIIDLRDNPGGRLSEIAYLYSYLANQDYIFINESEVTSKTSLFNANYFTGSTFLGKIVKGIFSPLYYGFTYFKVHKNKDGKYVYNSNAKLKHPKQNSFKGKIYVLINGGSFSASSIISSNLKGSKRALFVGEETGGAYNGTVAGQMPQIELPNSKIKVRFGLVVIRPYFKTDKDGRGIFPDKEIIPTINDEINNIDPEMNWILDDIKKNNL